MRYWDWHGDGSVIVVGFALACCAVELEAAMRTRPVVDALPAGARVVAVVAGTVTDEIAPHVWEALAELPDPVIVAFGACTCGGGPYWDSPVVTKGIDQIVKVDHLVAGCPPPPSALAAILDGVSRG